MARVEARLKLRGGIARFRIEDDLLDRQRRLAPHHLHRLRQTFPGHGRTQNIVPVDHRLQRDQGRLQSLSSAEGQHDGKQISIPFLGHQMVEQNAFLQRRQGIDVLDVGCAARRRCGQALDLLWFEINQRQHLRRDGHATCGDTIGGHIDQPVVTPHCCGQCRQRRRGEQRAHIGLEAGLPHTFDQRHRQQRMAAQLEEVILPAYPLDLEQLRPDPGQSGLDLAYRGFIALGVVGARLAAPAAPCGRACRWASTAAPPARRRPPAPCTRAAVRSAAAAGDPPGMRLVGGVSRPPAAYRPRRSSRASTTASRTSGCSASRASISPSSMRKPRILTWKSLRPRNSIVPSGRQRARSPVWYSRAPGSLLNGSARSARRSARAGSDSPAPDRRRRYTARPRRRPEPARPCGSSR